MACIGGSHLAGNTSSLNKANFGHSCCDDAPLAVARVVNPLVWFCKASRLEFVLVWMLSACCDSDQQSTFISINGNDFGFSWWL